MAPTECSAEPPSPRAELAAGLAAPRAWIAPKFLYDATGSALFAAICELPEYYPTRTEHAILNEYRDRIAAALGPGCVLVDLGAGDCGKAARLLPALRARQYVAVDIATEYTGTALARLCRSLPGLKAMALGADLSHGLSLPDSVERVRRVFFYPGSSIGNLAPDEAVRFLARLRAQCDGDGSLLVGIDLAKPRAVVEPAYDDALGLTAAFNLNVLAVANRTLVADFRAGDWCHVAFLDADRSRIEMHLEARRAVRVRWPGGTRAFAAGERIHTESSYKHDRAGFERMLHRAGFVPRHWWTDTRGWFAVVHAEPAVVPVAAGNAAPRAWPSSAAPWLRR